MAFVLAIVLFLAFIYLTNADFELKIGNKIISVETIQESEQS